MDICANLAVLGAGSWGSALAAVLARNRHRVCLWGRDPAQIELLQTHRQNQRYLPGIDLPAAITYSHDLEAATAGVEAIIAVVPTIAFRELLTALQQRRFTGPVVWACKGLEAGSGKFMHTVVDEVLGEDVVRAVVSGPTFALEIARGLPAAVSVAGADLGFATQVASWLHGESVRAYPGDDIVGVELCGALKNVLAIAAGVADGLQFGANARAALVTRGLAEMMRLGTLLGGRRETFMGLAGLGDLVLTCTDDQSRNRRLGLAMAEGLGLDDAIARIGQAVEGVKTAREAQRLAARHRIEMPITEQVCGILYESVEPRAAVRALLERDLTREHL